MRIEDALGDRRARQYMRRKARRMNEQTADLLPRVATAHELMHRVVDLQNRINQLTTQFAAKTEKKSKRHPVLYAIAGFLIAFALITSTPLKAVTYPLTIPFFTTGGMELQVTVWNVITSPSPPSSARSSTRSSRSPPTRAAPRRTPPLTEATPKSKRTTKPLRRASSRRSGKSSPRSSAGPRRSRHGTRWTTTASTPWTSSLRPCATTARARCRRWSTSTRPSVTSGA